MWGGHQGGPTEAPSGKAQRDEGKVEFPRRIRQGKGELTPRGFQAQAPLPPGHKGSPQPGAPGAQESLRYVQAAGAVEGTHPGLGCGRTR